MAQKTSRSPKTEDFSINTPILPFERYDIFSEIGFSLHFYGFFEQLLTDLSIQGRTLRLSLSEHAVFMCRR